MPIIDSRSDGFHERLDAIFDSLLEGPATGPEWTSLGHHVAATGRDVRARPGLGLTLAQAHQPARAKRRRRLPAAVRGCSAAARAPGRTPVAAPGRRRLPRRRRSPDHQRPDGDPRDLYRRRWRRRSSSNVSSPRSRPTSSAPAVDAAAIKIQDDFYGPAARSARSNRSCSRKLSEPNATASRSRGADQRPPGGVAGAAARAARVESPDTRSWSRSPPTANAFSPDTTRRVSQRIADTIREQLPAGNLYDDDKMTPRLIREALFSALSNRMHFASIALRREPVPALPRRGVGRRDRGGRPRRPARAAVRPAAPLHRRCRAGGEPARVVAQGAFAGRPRHGADAGTPAERPAPRRDGPADRRRPLGARPRTALRPRDASGAGPAPIVADDRSSPSTSARPPSGGCARAAPSASDVETRLPGVEPHLPGAETRASTPEDAAQRGGQPMEGSPGGCSPSGTALSSSPGLGAFVTSPSGLASGLSGPGCRSSGSWSSLMPWSPLSFEASFELSLEVSLEVSSVEPLWSFRPAPRVRSSCFASYPIARR